VRPPTRNSIAGKRTFRRRTQAFLVGIAALCAAASASADPNVSTKEAQARDVLAQIQQIDQSLGAAVEAYNLANVQLQKIEGDLRENRQQLKLARTNLKHAQKALAARLVAAYTSSEDNSTLALVLGATSFEDMLNRVEAINSTARQDASIVRQVSEYKVAVQRHRSELRTAHARQQDVVAQKAAQKQEIESRLATRRQMLSSIRSEIARMKAAEEAQQRRLAASAQARLVQDPPPTPSSDSLGVAASTPEGSTVAPPSGYSGIVGIAMRYLGVPYVWGGASPSGFDCSGLVQYAYAQLGNSVPHSTYALWPMGVAVSRSQLQPGDLVFFNGLGHMGIYIGNNQMIHAPHTGDVVKISSLTGWYASTYMGARRIG
jgi:cell wall-associated NlpC family hydrolase